MRIVSEISLGDFNAWSGAKRTIEDLERLDLMDEAESYIEEMFEGSMTDTELNDYLWFESDDLWNALNITTYDGYAELIADKEEEIEEAENNLEEAIQNGESEAVQEKLFDIVERLKEAVEDLKEEQEDAPL